MRSVSRITSRGGALSAGTAQSLPKKSPSREALKVKPKYRSEPEEDVATQLEAAGVRFDYEGVKVPYTIPAREAVYIADFPAWRTTSSSRSKATSAARST